MFLNLVCGTPYLGPSGPLGSQAAQCSPTKELVSLTACFLSYHVTFGRELIWLLVEEFAPVPDQPKAVLGQARPGR